MPSLVHVSKEVSSGSATIFETPGEKILLNGSELGKVDGCLTCSCLLIKLDKQSS